MEVDLTKIKRITLSLLKIWYFQQYNQTFNALLREQMEFKCVQYSYGNNIAFDYLPRPLI